LEMIIIKDFTMDKKSSKLLKLNGAGDRARTGDVQLGKFTKGIE